MFISMSVKLARRMNVFSLDVAKLLMFLMKLASSNVRANETIWLSPTFRLPPVSCRCELNLFLPLMIVIPMKLNSKTLTVSEK